MNVFNSLGSNYTLSSALKIVFSFGGKSEQKRLAKYLEKRYGGKAILTYKGREAISLALSSLLPGTVAINGFTCLAVYEAIVESGKGVQYLDISQSDLNFSAETLERALNNNAAINVVIVQNTLGIPCDIAGIARLCKDRGLVLIEDLAHSIGTRYASGLRHAEAGSGLAEAGEEAGTVGDFVILSFSQDKVVDAVSGGALIVRNPKLWKSDLHKQNTISLVQQLKDRIYPIATWKIRLGYSLGIGKIIHAFYKSLHILSSPFGNQLTDISELPGWYCANILRQFERLPATQAHRKKIAEIYSQALTSPFDIENASNLRFPVLLDGREQLIAFLRTKNIHISDIWYDAPIAPKKYLHKTNYAGECPHAERVSNMMVNLPTHINVSEADARNLAHLVAGWLKKTSEYRVAEVTDSQEWETFIAKLKPHSFLHSWKWGEHYQEKGSKVFRLGIHKDNRLVAMGLFILIKARRGSFLLCPHGPLFDPSGPELQLLHLLTDEAVKIAKQEGCAFIRFCPLSSLENAQTYHTLGFRPAPIHMHPELAWMLDITKSEDDLLREMRKTTRYLVKKMEKEGVEITQSTDPNDIDKFWIVYQATVERQQFTPFSKEYVRTEFELFAKDSQAAFFFGTYQGEIIAAAIIIFYNGQAFYHHSGSLQKSKDINASYLLQWRVIQEAKKRGCTLYNFWGISPTDKPDHPWAGLSLFKKGFGGFAEEYLHAQDKPLTAKYWLNYIVESVRRVRRGL